eukprot:scaffold147475_cov19-Tisochrysis_lutea.AAC.3
MYVLWEGRVPLCEHPACEDASVSKSCDECSMHACVPDCACVAVQNAGATPRRVTGLSCRRAAQFGSCVDEAEPARSLQGVHRGLRCCEWARHAIQHVCRHGWLQPRVVCSSGHAVCVCHVCCWGGLCFEEQYHVVEKDDDGDAAT